MSQSEYHALHKIKKMRQYCPEAVKYGTFFQENEPKKKDMRGEPTPQFIRSCNSHCGRECKCFLFRYFGELEATLEQVISYLPDSVNN